MKLGIAYKDFCTILNGSSNQTEEQLTIQQVYTDTRRIVNGKDAAFFALQGEFRDGHAFIEQAYEKGIRVFVVSQSTGYTPYEDAHYILVNDTLFALQELAKFHRNKFNYPVIAITGSAGKTTVKEWIYHLLSPELRIIRSPKSYNSTLGVPLSLLEMDENCDLALIEVGISKPGDAERLRVIVRPDYGVFTAFGRTHQENFTSGIDHLNEKLRLFSEVKKTYYPSSIHLTPEQEKGINAQVLRETLFKKELAHLPFFDSASVNNGMIAIAVAKLFSKDNLSEKICTLPQLALRMETFEGEHGNSIINDTYNLDLDALHHSLEYQLRVAGNKKRIVIIGLDDEHYNKRQEVEALVSAYQPDQLFIVRPDEVPTERFEHAVVLIKGTRKANMERLAQQYRLKKHKTYVEIDLNAVRHNITVFKKDLAPETKLLAMVKAQSYGSGVEKMAAFLEQQGIDCLGVAYADEGVELRKQGITLPILVMNAEEGGFEDCIHHQLEPAIYSFNQLDAFIRELIHHGKQAFPIHVKIDTGMKRLGFEIKDLQKVCEILQSQPEVYVKSIYSHLSDADNRRDKRFTEHQIKQFEQARQLLMKQLNYPFDQHLLNSEGIANYPEAQYSMVRLGIGMYGISSHPAYKRRLQPVLKWNSSISQIKTLNTGDSVGYSRTFLAEKPMKIAVIPVGYADGFRRSLSNGRGGVYIKDVFCPTLGRVCMDMIMVDITGLDTKEGDTVEIIGKRQALENLASAMDTIPYEVMTGISKRVHRVYVED